MNAINALLAFSLLLLKAAFGLVLGAFVATLILLATPLWLVEMLFANGAFSSARLAALQDCESPLDWMFSRVDPKGPGLHETFVRLWGFEFRYR